MRARDIFVRCSPPRHRCWLDQHRLGPLAPAVSHDRRRARTSTTTLTDFCNRSEARAHWRTIVTRRHAAFHGEALHVEVLRRCETAPIAQVRVSSARGAEAGSGPELDIQSPPSAPAHWRVTGSSESGLGPPRERRANGRTLGNEPGCLSLCEIRPFLFEPDWPAQRAHARRARASSHPRNGRRIVDGSAPFPGRQPAGTTRQQRVAQSACSARTTSAKRSFASRCAANFDIHHSQSDSPIKTKHGEFAHFSVHNLHRSAGAQRHSFRTLQANTLCTAAELPLRRNQVTPKSDIGVVQQEQ